MTAQPRGRTVPVRTPTIPVRRAPVRTPTIPTRRAPGPTEPAPPEPGSADPGQPDPDRPGPTDPGPTDRAPRKPRRTRTGATGTREPAMRTAGGTGPAERSGRPARRSRTRPSPFARAQAAPPAAVHPAAAGEPVPAPGDVADHADGGARPARPPGGLRPRACRAPRRARARGARARGLPPPCRSLRRPPAARARHSLRQELAPNGVIRDARSVPIRT